MKAWARIAASGSISALLITIKSANSITPFLIACKSSPAFGNCNNKNKSVIPATAISLWPTPTVSTITTSWPAASATNRASRVFSATPPSVPEEGLGRIKACSWTDNFSMRVLSPKIDPPDKLDEGSIAKTATRWPCSIRYKPRVSIKVDFPTPGTPEIPRRNEQPVCGNKVFKMSSARARWSTRVDSNKVIDLARARRCAALGGAIIASTKAWSAASSEELADMLS